MNKSERYLQRGVSASKEDVHHAIKNSDKGLYPKAFCKIIPDYLTGDADYCIVMHADGAGTKSSLAYAYWKETGDISVWKGIAQDALVMNIDDLLCVGAVDNILLSSTIGRNIAINLFCSRATIEKFKNFDNKIQELFYKYAKQSVDSNIGNVYLSKKVLEFYQQPSKESKSKPKYIL